MSVLNKKIKIVLFAIMMSVVLLPGVMTSASETIIAEKSKNNDDFDVTVQIDAKYSADMQGTFARVNIENNTGSNFSGTVYIRQDRKGVLITKYDISVADGETTCVFDRIDISHIDSLVMDLKIKSLEGKEVYNDVFYLSEKDVNEEVKNDSETIRYNIGVLSNNTGFIKGGEDNYDYHSRLFEDIIYDCSDKIIYFSHMDNVDVKKDFDYLVIDGFDTATLDKSEIDKIIEFVEEGGTLVLGTGSKAKDVLGGFSDLIDYSNKGVLKKNVSKGETEGDGYKSYEIWQRDTNNIDDVDYNAFINVWDKVWRDYYKGEDIAKKYPQYEWTLKDTGEFGYGFETGEELTYDEAQLDISNASYKVKMNFFEESIIEKGKGKIIILPFEINECRGILNIDDIAGIKMNFSGVSPESMVVKSDRTNISVFVFIIILYIIISVVLIIVVVKKFDKPHLVTVAVAVSGIIFSLVFYFAAKNQKIEDTLVYVTVNDYDKGSVISSYTKFCLVNQENSKYKLDIDSDAEVFFNGNNYVYQYDDANYFTSDDWDESRGIIIDKTVGKTGEKIEINKMTPFSVCEFELCREIENDGRFEFEENENGYKITNNTGKDMRCVVLAVDDMYIVLGDIKNSETVNVQDLLNGKKDIDWEQFLADDISVETAMSVAKQYRNLYLAEDQIRVYGIESFDSDIFSSDWEGMTIATQMLCTKKALGIISLGDTNIDKSIIGSYFQDGYEYIVYDDDDEYDERSVILLDSDALVLYDVEKDLTIKSICIPDSNFNNGIMNSFNLGWADSNPKILIYNYKTDNYDLLYSTEESKEITDTADYYGINKPIRLKFLGVAAIPDIYLEVK